MSSPINDAIDFTAYHQKSQKNSFLDLTKVHRKESNNDVSQYDRSVYSKNFTSRKSLMNLGFGNSYSNNRIAIGSRLNLNNSENLLAEKKARMFRKYPSLQSVFEHATLEEIKILYSRLQLALLLIDLFCFVSDLIVVTWCYFNHFEYNKHGYCLNNSDNIQRFICLAITLSVVITLILRNITRRHLQNAKYLLSLRVTIPIQRLQYKQLAIEIMIHVIQPYPYICYNFTMIILGIPVVYSLDMIFFSLSILRLYVVIKVLKNWNVYTNSRGNSISTFFGNNDMIVFLYKTCIKNYGSLTLIIIFFVIGLIGGYIFKVFENYQPYESESVFGDLWICVWFIGQTMTNIGFGDYVPSTLVGRCITIFLCFVGIVVESLFTVTFILFVTFTDESKLRAYEEINLIHTKGRETNLYNIYFRKFVSNKVMKLLPKKEFSMKEILDAKSNMKILQEKYYLRVFSSAKIPVTVSDFSTAVKQTLDPEFEYCIEWHKDRNDIIKPYIDYFCDTILDYRADVFNCVNGNNQMVNIILLIYWCGMSYPLIDYKKIRKDSIVKKKNVDNKMKEFHVMFKEKKKKIAENQIMKRNSFATNSAFDTMSMMTSPVHQQEDDENDDDDCSNYEESLSMTMTINDTESHCD